MLGTEEVWMVAKGLLVVCHSNVVLANLLSPSLMRFLSTVLTSKKLQFQLTIFLGLHSTVEILAKIFKEQVRFCNLLMQDTYGNVSFRTHYTGTPSKNDHC